MQGCPIDGKCCFNSTVSFFLQILRPLMTEFFLFQNNIDDYIDAVIGTIIKEHNPNENDINEYDALGVDCVSFDLKLLFIIFLPLSIPLTYFMIICFSLLLRSIHSHIHRHDIHQEKRERVDRKYYLIHVRTRVQYFFNMDSYDYIFFLLSSLQSNQIKYCILFFK